MIILHRINGDEFALNSRHIETMEECPDTVLTLTNERKYIVKEKVDEIIKKIVQFEKNISINVTSFSKD